MDARKTLGLNVRRLRVAKGISQEALANESGVDRSYVGRIERGSENVTITTLEAFAQVLGVEVRDLFDRVADPDAAAPALRAGRKAKVKT